MAESENDWQVQVDRLKRWHQHGDARAAELALTFIESVLRRCVPPAARRRWPPQQVEDAVQGFLVRLLEQPLPAGVLNRPAAYLIRSFRNWCIDAERGRKRDPVEPWEELPPTVQSPTPPEVRQHLKQTVSALDTLPIAERVALKMTDAPQLLTWEELGWLGTRSGLSAEAVRQKVLSAPPVFELTFLFDPGPPPTDKKTRRDRMERFRKRRERARARLRAAVEAGS